MLTVVAGILIVAGSVFTMLAGIGTLRFSDVYARMHPAAKGPTLGLLLVALGAALELRKLGPVLALSLVVVLQFLAAPLGAHLLGRAIHISLPLQADEVDELADDLGAVTFEADASDSD
jgi:multicomponent Na+:H+ antiporter subunit G